MSKNLAGDPQFEIVFDRFELVPQVVFLREQTFYVSKCLKALLFDFSFIIHHA
ncbi:hypothetical protein [uncultured Parabacteroides sp.]|uniref:hypothetical protein n=1 Tax=uncultured Parabacteroides sp. TaxID=512312 RepID=UPI0026EB111D|nr:hypothetical protein [uncultured Parabacteroides sp.]